MAAWVLIPCLKQLFAEFDWIAPRRDKASDGSIGDTAHQQESSDHNRDEEGNVPIHDADKVNEVHAIDVTAMLDESDLTMEKVVQFLLGRCRSGAEKRLRYIIFNRRIWAASSNWVQKTYAGASSHTEHAHFSASYESAHEASTASWHLEDIPVALTAADKAWITNTIAAKTQQAIDARLAKIGDAVVHGQKMPWSVDDPKVPNGYQRDLADLAGDVWSLGMRGKTRGGGPVPPDGVYGQLLAELAQLSAKVDALQAKR
ncbi:hypothetical protein [Paractinoplanes toevensis]|uniref:Uncharacterized protein n=1 Tax=Paractinoplanes toevensis TaxID=571911 RepID=A0A919W1S2_9ACTN|nr:hypothetical protein [Actinoplanes toevensis]GIM88745.1 hypothetical protein Ato02nite_005380 [Actinoplanes toevensis]